MLSTRSMTVVRGSLVLRPYHNAQNDSKIERTVSAYVRIGEVA
jgi:hypothetical protein